MRDGGQEPRGTAASARWGRRGSGWPPKLSGRSSPGGMRGPRTVGAVRCGPLSRGLWGPQWASSLQAWRSGEAANPGTRSRARTQPQRGARRPLDPGVVAGPRGAPWLGEWPCGGPRLGPNPCPATWPQGGVSQDAWSPCVCHPWVPGRRPC